MRLTLRLCGSSAPRANPWRFPSTTAETSAAVPLFTWTTAPPAKSRIPARNCGERSAGGGEMRARAAALLARGGCSSSAQAWLRDALRAPPAQRAVSPVEVVRR